MRPLVWFRADLRTKDNAALYYACKAAANGVVAVFTICPWQWRDEHAWADVKVEFLLRNLGVLSERLAELNVPLRILETPRFDGVPGKLLDLARSQQCDALYFNEEYEVNESRRDDAARDLFERNGLQVHRFTDQVILDPRSVRTNDGGFYSVFTPFKKRWLDVIHEQGPPDRYPDPKKQPEMPCKPDPIPDSVAGFDPEAGKPDLWPEGERAARRRLDEFIHDRINDYKKKRDRPGTDATSRLSPYLTLGVLSPRQCLYAAVEANDGRFSDRRAGPSTWISELIWREFYRHVLVGYPRVSMHRAFRPETEAINWIDNQDAFDAWCRGRTGYPIVDAGMRQLLAEGWMHNRVRMIVAMFLTKDLLIDWRQGERHFMRHLVDGDLASNNGGWQWAASTGTDAAPYFRIFNPSSQSGRFDSQGEYIRRFVPELRGVPAKLLHDPDKLASELGGRIDYPAPICDHKRARRRAMEAFKSLK